MTATQIPTQPGMGRSIIDHDDRNRNYPARGFLFGAQEPIVKKTHRRGSAYDQGRTSTCVAQTGKGMLNTAPFSSFETYYRRSRYSIDQFYEGAQGLDEWPGTDYDGTSGKGMCEWLLSAGIISEYRWCFGLDDLLRTLSHHGPVGVGTWWRSGMWEPDDNGLVRYEGSYAGGHQIEAIGVDPSKEEVEFMNSWGKQWGMNGRFRMKWDQLDLALRDDADAHTYVTVN